MMGNIAWHEINDVDDKDNDSAAAASSDKDKPIMIAMWKDNRIIVLLSLSSSITI